MLVCVQEPQQQNPCRPADLVPDLLPHIPHIISYIDDTEDLNDFTASCTRLRRFRYDPHLAYQVLLNHYPDIPAPDLLKYTTVHLCNDLDKWNLRFLSSEQKREVASLIVDGIVKGGLTASLRLDKLLFPGWTTLAKHALMNAPDCISEHAASIATLRKCELQMLDCLIDAGVDTWTNALRTTCAGAMPFDEEAERHVRYYLGKGADPTPALYGAVLQGTLRATRILTDAGATVSIQDLMISTSNKEILEFLLSRAPKEILAPPLITRVLVHAIKTNNGQADCVFLILDHIPPDQPLSPSTLTDLFKTTCIFAVQERQVPILQRLVEAGAPINEIISENNMSLQKDHYLNQALIHHVILSGRNNVPIIEYFYSVGASLSHERILQHACYQDNPTVMSVVLEKGCAEFITLETIPMLATHGKANHLRILLNWTLANKSELINWDEIVLAACDFDKDEVLRMLFGEFGYMERGDLLWLREKLKGRPCIHFDGVSGVFREYGVNVGGE